MASGIRMTASRVSPPAIAIAVLFLSTCALAHDDTVPDAAELAASGLPGDFGTPAQPAVLYLNRCVGFCTVSPGPDSAILNRSSLVNIGRNIPGFSYGDASWNALARYRSRTPIRAWRSNKDVAGTSPTAWVRIPGNCRPTP